MGHALHPEAYNESIGQISGQAQAAIESQFARGKARSSKAPSARSQPSAAEGDAEEEAFKFEGLKKEAILPTVEAKPLTVEQEEKIAENLFGDFADFTATEAEDEDPGELKRAPTPQETSTPLAKKRRFESE